MLFRPRDLERIAAGTITLAFRRWDRPRVKVGSQQKTAVGVVEFTSCEIVDTVTRRTTRAPPGFASPADVEERLRKTGPRLPRRPAAWSAGPARGAPRRRRRTRPCSRRLRQVAHGPIRHYLQAIAARPGRSLRGPRGVLRARDGGVLKRDVRKLKELGLTESLDVGYRLSPRGGRSCAATQRLVAVHPHRGEREPAAAAIAAVSTSSYGHRRSRGAFVVALVRAASVRPRPRTTERRTRGCGT